jgi:hypothetical protein
MAELAARTAAIEAGDRSTATAARRANADAGIAADSSR